MSGESPAGGRPRASGSPPCKAWAGLETEEVRGDDGGGGGFLGKL